MATVLTKPQDSNATQEQRAKPWLGLESLATAIGGRKSFETSTCWRKPK